MPYFLLFLSCGLFAFTRVPSSVFPLKMCILSNSQVFTLFFEQNPKCLLWAGKEGPVGSVDSWLPQHHHLTTPRTPGNTTCLTGSLCCSFPLDASPALSHQRRCLLHTRPSLATLSGQPPPTLHSLPHVLLLS